VASNSEAATANEASGKRIVALEKMWSLLEAGMLKEGMIVLLTAVARRRFYRIPIINYLNTS
jgi:hypothetical protein